MKIEAKKINEFIINNYKEMSNKEMALVCEVKPHSIACRKTALYSKGIIEKVVKNTNKIAKAIKKLEMTKAEIQDFIIKNHETMDNKSIGEKLNLPTTKISGNYVALKKQGKLTTKTIENVAKDVAEDVGKDVDDSSNFGNHEGANKVKARVKMVSPIVDSGVYGIVPTLPNTNWTIEQMINAINPNNTFLGVERKTATFKVMKAKLERLRENGFVGSTHKGDISSVIYGKRENAYAHMILDYCGNLNTISKELEYAIQNKIIMKDGIMAITFATAIRGTDSDSLKLKGLASTNNTDGRCESARATEAYFHKITGWDFEVVEFFHYCDSSPMTLVVIKRIK